MTDKLYKRKVVMSDPVSKAMDKEFRLVSSTIPLD
jgi:hypothetical protein